MCVQTHPGSPLVSLSTETKSMRLNKSLYSIFVYKDSNRKTVFNTQSEYTGVFCDIYSISGRTDYYKEVSNTGDYLQCQKYNESTQLQCLKPSYKSVSFHLAVIHVNILWILLLIFKTHYICLRLILLSLPIYCK